MQKLFMRRKDWNRGVVICDLDGTLADGSHRTHWLTMYTPPNILRFLEDCIYDKVHAWCKVMLDALWSKGYYIVILTARSQGDGHLYQAYTLEWLRENDISYDKLIMRTSNDNNLDDIEFKRNVVLKRIIPIYKNGILLAIDDSALMCAMYRSLGVPALQIGDGQPSIAYEILSGKR